MHDRHELDMTYFGQALGFSLVFYHHKSAYLKCSQADIFTEVTKLQHVLAWEKQDVEHIVLRI